MNEKNKKKQIAKITVFITSIFVIFLSVTYAFINLTLFGTKRQVITVGNLQLKLEEKNEIKLENAFPMYDEVGMIQDAFQFQLINETNMDIKYILKLEDITEEDANRLDNSIVRYGLVKGNNEPIIGSLSDIEKENYKLEEATISKNTTIDYSLRLWIDYKVTDDKEISGKSLKYRIGVAAEQGKKYVVDFDTKDPSITVEGGGTYGNLPSPTKAGYKFNGWYTEEEGEGKKIESDTKFETKEDQTLYAYFEKLPNAPELGNNLVPVTYNEKSKNWQVADASNSNEEWYDYDKQNWANAVTLDHTRVLDLSGKNNHGTIHGTTLKNNEVTLDGVDDYIDCGYANENFGTTFSTVVRFKVESFPTTDNGGYIISNAEGAGMYLALVNSKKIHCAIHVGGTDYQRIMDTEPITEGTWYEVAMTFDGTKMILYLDGKEVGSISLSATSSMKESPMPFLIGANPDGNGRASLANITVSKAQIYKRALTANDISTIHSDGELKAKDGLLVDYDFKMDKTMESGTTLPMDMINTMFVWIPRFSYTIKSEDGENYFGKKEEGRTTEPSKDLPGEIDVHFVAKEDVETGSAQYTNENKRKDTWKTPDAFTFGGKQVSGIWAGKFELGGILSAGACTNATCDISSLTIKPNVTSLTNQTVSSFFYAIKSMQKENNPFGFATDQNKVDVHMIKNSEWGVVAYLSQSKYGKYGNSAYSSSADKQVRINNCKNYITGIGASSQDASEDASVCTNDNNKYNSENGQAASTTGNITGVYDMSGGAYDYVMGALSDGQEPVKPAISQSGFIKEGEASQIPDAKYYDLYTEGDIAKACNGGICYGHALSETLGWYDDKAVFVSSSGYWLTRSGYSDGTLGAGVFYFSQHDGSALSSGSSRAVLVSF